MTEHNEIHTATIEENPAPHQEAGGGSLLEIDGTLIFIAASFVLFTIIMQRVFYGPLKQIRETRDQHINGLKHAGEQLLSEAERLNTEYTEKIKTARKKASDNTTAVISDANQEKAKILGERKQQVSEFLNIERLQIKEEKAKSMQELTPHINTYASDICRKILDEDILLAIGENNERNR
ncbi:MAG: hypothetical protein A2Y25_06320 [Candidatus Melainabacteria bacterium GWF2_37_15]|nr:MAG: hypothetical protein A2Y25_06320 [Candidatus Melainabacteria bacterium GWF2_37_15]